MNQSTDIVNAGNFFNELFNSSLVDFNAIKKINIIVIGAGTFPSFLILLHQLKKIASHANEFHFTLIDPDEKKIKLFLQSFLKMVFSENDKISIQVHTIDVKTFLLQAKNRTFDLIYFEHPDFSIFHLLFSKINYLNATLNLSFREAIPYLLTISHSKTILIATMIYKLDLIQFLSLLKFSFKIDYQLIKRVNFFSEGKLYSYGLITSLTKKNVIPEEQVATDIHHKNNQYVLFLLSAIFFFILSPAQLNVFSLFCVMMMLFYHRYQLTCAAIKMFLLMVQGLIIAVVYYFMT